MKRKKIYIGLILVAVLLSSVTVTYAFMFRKTEQIVNTFRNAEVSCSIIENVENGTKKNSIQVQNTGNVEEALRLRMVSYWVDAKGRTVGKPSEMPTVSYNSENWTKDGDIYYCKDTVSATELSPELLDAPIVLTESEYEGETVYQYLEVFAEAIQANPDLAMEEAWGK